MPLLPLDLAPVSGIEESTAREYVASFAQRRLWFFEQIQPGTSVLHMSFVLRLKGRLNVTALQRAFEEIQRRHETLRTAFKELAGELVQVISDGSREPLEHLDLRGLPEAERGEELTRLVAETGGQPFDLRRGPLWRARLIQLRDDESRLAMCLHHLVSDGLSCSIFLREVGALYKAFDDQRLSPLPALVWQYGDFAEWQAGLEHDAASRVSLAHWVERLRGAPAALELPADRPHPAVQSFRGGTVSARLSKELAWRLERLGRDRGASLFMVLLGGFSALLSRLSGLDDLVVGAPVAGRIRPEVESLLGLFINTLPLRMDLSGNPTFRSLIDRAKATAFDAFEHQAVPFEQIVAAVRPDRARSNSPLFQVLFNMQMAGADVPVRIGSLVAEVDAPFESASKFDLTVYATRRPDGVDLSFVYNADLFDKARIVEMAAQYHHLLTQAVANPDVELAAVDLRTPEASLTLPDPSVALAGGATGSIVERLRAHASSNPDGLAIVSPERTFTYRELDRRIDVLAARLREKGIGAGDVVAIHAHRGAPLVLSLLGVMKAGAAFCILDPRQPPARLSACVRAAKPAGFIQLAGAGDVTAELQQEVDRFCGWTIRVGNDDDSADAGVALVSVEAPLDPDRLTYVAFTSGSTGGVKAIAGTERPLVHFLDWHARTFGLTSADAFSVLSGLAHDPLLRDILTPLWVGGRLEMPPDVDLRDADATARWMAQRNVSVAHLTPPMARLLSDAAERTSTPLPSLRHVFFAGDALTSSVVDRIRKAAPNAECVNFYGATETPQAMGFWRVPAPTPPAMALGRGIDDVQLLVMEANGRLAGVGEPGEIWIRTPYLSQGYLGDAELTGARFVQNPFTTDELDRVYRSGDIGRYRPDGSVELVGRGDLQVKIRGFRVELQEVERALLQHPAIADVAAITRGGEDGELDLVACCVHETAHPVPTAAALRAFLKTVLPEYAIPGRFERLPRLPMTPNGKVDRAALQVAGGGAFHSTPIAEREKTPVEGQVAGIWAQMLGVPAIGVDDNFFEMGGHSLLAARVIRALNNTFAVTLPLRALFDAPTVGRFCDVLVRQIELERAPDGRSSAAEPRAREMTPTERRLAAIWEKMLGVGSVGPSDNFFALGAESHPIAQLFEGIRAEFGKDLPVLTLMESPTLEGLARRIDSSSASATSLVMPLKADGTRTPVFGIHDGAGYFFYWKFAAALGDDRPVYGIQAEGHLNGRTRPYHPYTTIEELAERYIREIKLIQPEGPYQLAGVCFGGVVAFEMARQLAARGEQVSSLFMFSANVRNNPHRATARESENGPRLSVWQRARAHVGQLSNLRSTDRAKYVAEHVAGHVTQQLAWVTLRLVARLLWTEITGRWNMLMGRPISPQLIHDRYLRASDALLRRYRPEPYSGRAVMFAAANENPAPLWTDLLGGGLEVHKMPGRHVEMLGEPTVNILASVVRKYLDEADAETLAVDQSADPTAREAC